MTNPSFHRPPHLIELQLLRHGESQNQLLSPLTDYLALCGDHPATTVHIPLKHRALQTRLRALDYKDSSATRLDQLDELAAVVTKLLAEFPGLNTELSSCNDCLAHVSLATSAAELAMVPFELAMMPLGTAGAGQRLGLQPHIPVCLTRRSRNVNRPCVNWKRCHRILMISSDAGGEVPATQHYAALRELVDPWLDVVEHHDEPDALRAVEKRLVLLENPTADSLAEFLKKESFSHIHILAHGAPHNEHEPRFGVALHSTESSRSMDIVDGERLGGLLGYRPESPDDSPLVVSLAICQSGRQGSVVMPGSSLAFELHDKGVPIVVGSQFPLSFGGAMVMTKELYGGLLAGRDPRYVIWKTRTELFNRAGSIAEPSSAGLEYEPPMHDWASMTVYAKFPEEIDQIIPEVERERYIGRLTPKMAFLDTVARTLHEADVEEVRGTTEVDQQGSSSTSSTSKFKRMLSWKALQAPREEIRKFREWIEHHSWSDTSDRRRADSKGRLASVQKRLGLVFLQVAAYGKQEDGQSNIVEQLFQEVESRVIDGTRIVDPNGLTNLLERIGMHLLLDAKRSYDEVFRINRLENWALVQSLSLEVAIYNELPMDSYNTATYLNDLDLANFNPQRRAWALGAMAELALIDLVHRRLKSPESPAQEWADQEQKFQDAVNDLIRMANQEPNEVRSALLQLKRYDTDLIILAATETNSNNQVPGQAMPRPDLTQVEEYAQLTKHSSYSSKKRRRLKFYGGDLPSSLAEQAASDEPKVKSTVSDLCKLVRKTVDPLFSRLDLEFFR